MFFINTKYFETSSAAFFFTCSIYYISIFFILSSHLASVRSIQFMNSIFNMLYKVIRRFLLCFKNIKVHSKEEKERKKKGVRCLVYFISQKRLNLDKNNKLRRGLLFILLCYHLEIIIILFF